MHFYPCFIRVSSVALESLAPLLSGTAVPRAAEKQGQGHIDSRPHDIRQRSTQPISRVDGFESSKVFAFETCSVPWKHARNSERCPDENHLDDICQ